VRELIECKLIPRQQRRAGRANHPDQFVFLVDWDHTNPATGQDYPQDWLRFDQLLHQGSISDDISRLMAARGIAWAP